MKRVLIATLLLPACAPGAGDETELARDTVSHCSNARPVAALPPVLLEASGVAVSIRHPGVLWSHNDSGEPFIFAIDTMGQLKARVRVPVPNGDWEDIEIAACPEGSCVYLGAIGDNLQSRRDRAVLRFPEPDLDATHAAPPARFAYRIPGGPRDMEALFVLPGQRMYVITKGRSGPITLYVYPETAAVNTVNTLEQVQLLTTGLVQLPEMVTGAGASADGKIIAVRSYGAVQLYRFDGARLAPLLEGSGFDLQSLSEFQGEGVDITDDGTVYLVSEKGLGDEAPPLSRVQCLLR